jgi:hypothetical protein
LEDFADSVFWIAMSESKEHKSENIDPVLVCIRVIISSNLGKGIDTSGALIKLHPLLLKFPINHSAIRHYNVRY